MASLSWLHLSDLHCGMSEQGIIWSNIENELFEDLNRLNDCCGLWDLFCLRGFNKDSLLRKGG